MVGYHGQLYYPCMMRNVDDRRGSGAENVEAIGSALAEDDTRIRMTIWAWWTLRLEDVLNMDDFAVDVINGMAPRVVRGVRSCRA